MTIFRRFPKIFQNCSEGKANVSKHFSEIFRRLPKISEDFQGGIDDVSIIQEHIQVLFKGLWKHSNGYHFSNFGNHNDGDLFTCEEHMLSSRVKI